MRSQLFLVLSTTFAATIPTWNSHLPQERDVVPGQTCDQYGHFETSTYILYNNLWGKSLGRGDQCTTLHSNFSMESSSGPESISWTTNWNWSEAASQVKSYANVVLKQLGSKQVSQYNSIPAYWNFNYTGEGLVADVAFDIFTTSGLGDGDDYEIMLWLGKYGDAAPISSSAHPIATNVNLVGKVFDLYKGPNQSMTVYSFVMHKGDRTSVNFHGDLVEVFHWLIDHNLLNGTQHLKQIGAGTETFLGRTCLFTTTKYWISAT